jgi:hypothetical protein
MGLELGLSSSDPGKSAVTASFTDTLMFKLIDNALDDAHLAFIISVSSPAIFKF